MKRLIKLVIAIFIFAIGGFWWLWGSNFQGNSNTSLHATSVTKINGSNVSLAVSDILIFKTPENDIGAIQFTQMTFDSGADYISWFVPSSSNLVDFQSAKEKKGHVFEKYWRTRTGFDRYNVADVGGVYYIECGSIMLEWSASTWIYFPSGYEITITDSKNIKDIIITDSSLKWHKT